MQNAINDPKIDYKNNNKLFTQCNLRVINIYFDPNRIWNLCMNKLLLCYQAQ